jgi:hypothetical protein
MALGESFSAVWRDPACPVELKKQIVRTVIEEVLVEEKPAGQLSFIIHWKGGSHTALTMQKPTSSSACRTADDDLDVIRKMAPRYGDDVIAAVLNKLDRRTGTGRRWSRLAVKTARCNHDIAGHTRTVVDTDVLSLQRAAKYTQTSDATIKKLAAGGVLPLSHPLIFAFTGRRKVPGTRPAPAATHRSA